MNASQIAKQLGISIPAVQQAEWRALRKLKAGLLKLGVTSSGVIPSAGHHLNQLSPDPTYLTKKIRF